MAKKKRPGAGKAAGRQGGKAAAKRATAGRQRSGTKHQGGSATRGPARAHRQTAPPAGRGRRQKGSAGFSLPPDARVFRVGVEHGTDLAHFLAESLPGRQSVRAIRRALDQGRCSVNGQAENFGSRKLIRGDLVAFVPPTATTAQPRFRKRDVVHVDDELIVYDKPPGLPVTATDAGKGPHLVGLLREHFGETVEAAHRLDADTSGLVLLARDPAMLAHLQRCFQEHRVQKSYLALVRGVPKDRGERSSYLLLQEKGTGYERWGTGKGRGALQAITTWQVEERFKKTAALVRIEPKTGRTHQIRVHFAEMGHPLVGDRVYGDRRDPVFASRHLLHAAQIAVPGPDGTERRFRSRLPEDFRQVMEQLSGL